MATRRRRRSTALVVSEDSGLLENLAQWLEDDGIFFTIHVYAPKSGRSSLSFVR